MVKQFSCFCGGVHKTIPSWGPRSHEICGDNSGLGREGPQLEILRREFSFLRQAQRAALPWDRIHGELWLKSQVSLRRPLQNPAHPPKGKADFVPKGYCFKFHKDRKCLPSCTFKHLCYRCEGSHPISKCNFRGSSKIASSQPRPAKSSLSASQPPNSSKSWEIRFSPGGLHPFHCWIFVIWFHSRFSRSVSRWRKSRTATILMSALDNPEAVDAKLQKELEAHRLAGPFQSPPLSPF